MICFSLLKTVLLHTHNYYFPSSYSHYSQHNSHLPSHNQTKLVKICSQKVQYFNTSHLNSLLFVQLSYITFSILYVVRVLNDQAIPTQLFSTQAIRRWIISVRKTSFRQL